ncbi:MAG: penicillin-binding protein 2 [Gammaproteobacteria bacterium]|nr:penicillin-binding protein 2 [Gammaproteobacteria bacterium]MCH9743365.1 penicillin-binding protein 2 [Gammaproteobacteria bacterium]
MKHKLTINNQKWQRMLFQRRYLMALLIVLLFTVLLIMRLAYLQIQQQHFYATLSKQNLLSIVPTEPDRGLIYDRNGILLAKNIPVFTLSIIPGKVHNMQTTLANLKSIITLTPEDIKAFHHSIIQHRRYDPVLLKLNLSELEIAKFYVNQYRLPGVIVQSRMARQYPLGATTGNVVGYVARINANELKQVNPENYSASDYFGKTGIENYYEDQLHGKVGAEQAEIDARGRILRTLKQIPATSGKNIYLTIDSNLQAFAEKALGDNNGAIVAIQPATGQILALVTKPTYDPNLFVNGISGKQYQQLLSAAGHPLYDRTIRGLYSPGSTIKPSFAIAGLNDGVITPDFKIYDPGWFRVANTQHIFHDWKYNGHGWVNVSKAITQSCDTFFFNLSIKLGIKRIDDAMKMFGFGSPTDVDLPNELSGIVPTPEWKRANRGSTWFTGDSVNMDIGQGLFSVTPLQLAQDVAMIAEHGKRFKPHLVLKFQNPDNSFTSQSSTPEPTVTLNNPQYWDLVIQAMTQVVDSPYGTAEAFGSHDGYEVAGKTGTAQVFGKQRDEERSNMNIPKRLRNNHLFISFAPVKNPQIALAVVVEHASFADRIAGDITRYYMAELKGAN